MKGVRANNFTGGLLLGGVLAILTFLIMGASSHDGPALVVPVHEADTDRAVMPLASAGRYQIATWQGGGGYGAFVLDTATGTTKVAYSSGTGPDGKRVNNLGKSFQQMK